MCRGSNFFFLVSGEVITGKWQNIRDSFTKSLRKKSGDGRKTKYLYHDNLTFLLKVVQPYETQSSLDDSQNVQQSQVTETELEKEAVTDEMQVQSHVRQVDSRDSAIARGKERQNAPKRRRLQEDVDKRLLQALQNPPDEDEAFFISITPMVQKMTDEEKLEFRMSVLKLIQNINRQKRYQSSSFITCQPGPSSSSSSRPSTSFSHHSFLHTDSESVNTQQATLYEQNQQQLSPSIQESNLFHDNSQHFLPL